MDLQKPHRARLDWGVAMSLIQSFKDMHYRVGPCQAIEYNRKDTALFKPGFLGELYFKLRGERYSKRDGTGILEMLFCGMTDLSYDAIVSYLASRAIVVLGVWQDEKNFKVAGLAFPTIMIGAGEQRACFAGYGFLREFWGSEEQEVLAALGLSVLFSELNLLSIHGIRYSGNAQTARFMQRFGFRDVGTVPHYMLRRGELVDGVVSTLRRERFEEVLAEMLSEDSSGEGRQRRSRSADSAGHAPESRRPGANRAGSERECPDPVQVGLPGIRES